MASSNVNVALFLALNLLLLFSYSPATAVCNPASLDVCVDVLNHLFNAGPGFEEPDKAPCCAAIDGLVDVKPEVCVCAALKTAAYEAVVKDLNVGITALLRTCNPEYQVPLTYVCYAD